MLCRTWQLLISILRQYTTSNCTGQVQWPQLPPLTQGAPIPLCTPAQWRYTYGMAEHLVTSFTKPSSVHWRIGDTQSLEHWRTFHTLTSLFAWDHFIESYQLLLCSLGHWHCRPHQLNIDNWDVLWMCILSLDCLNIDIHGVYACYCLNAEVSIYMVCVHISTWMRKYLGRWCAHRLVHAYRNTVMCLIWILVIGCRKINISGVYTYILPWL